MNRTNVNVGRKMTPKGQMSSSGNGPAIMMMPPHIRQIFMPDPPLRHLPPPKRKRPKIHPSEEGTSKSKRSITGVAAYMQHFEHGKAPERVIKPTNASVKQMRNKKKEEKMKAEMESVINEYQREQEICKRENNGEFQGMNCFNTLFVGRLAYEVTEGKLLREFEAYGPVKDLKLITDKNGKSRGYAFIEFEHSEDMKRAFRAADGMRIEGRHIVVDVERGHTAPNWLPRRLGGGLGGTRLGGKDVNVTVPGRFDPKARQREHPPMGMMDGPGGGPPGGPMGYDHGFPPDRRGHGGGYGMYGGPRDGPPPGYFDQRGPPPPGYYDEGRGGGRGPPPPYNGFPRQGGGGGPPPGYFDDYRGPPPNDRGMKRGRDYGGPPDRRDRRRYG